MQTKRKYGSISIKIVAYSLTLFLLHPVYADDAQTICSQIHADAERSKPAFIGSQTSGDTITCANLPQHTGDFDGICKAVTPPKTEVPSCAVTYYADMPADTVVQCSSIPASRKGDLQFKYVLCTQHQQGQHIWALMVNHTGKNLPPSVFSG